eukprot:1979066-Prorocentrum_lima.AAC.1
MKRPGLESEHAVLTNPADTTARRCILQTIRMPDSLSIWPEASSSCMRSVAARSARMDLRQPSGRCG